MQSALYFDRLLSRFISLQIGKKNESLNYFAHPNSVRSFGRAIANRIEQISQENGVNVFFVIFMK